LPDEAVIALSRRPATAHLVELRDRAADIVLAVAGEVDDRLARRRVLLRENRKMRFDVSDIRLSCARPG